MISLRLKYNKMKFVFYRCGFICLFAAMVFAVQHGYAQADTGYNKIPLSLPEYLFLTGKNNFGYAAQKFNVNMAEADIETARIFPDPELSVGAFNNQNQSLKLGYGFNAGLSTTFELGGKERPGSIWPKVNCS